MHFTFIQLDRLGDLWDRMRSHRFLLDTRDGTLPDEVFATWLQQDYLFVEAAIPFLGGLLPKAPLAHRQPLTQAISALYDELALFKERARAVGVVLDDVAPSFICHAYIQFLLASAYRGSYAEAFTVLYVAEKAYHDAWTVVRAGLDPASPWYPFVENWAGDDFAAYVAFLERELNALAAAAGADEHARMARAFEDTVKYEIAFWEMAFTGAAWPGLEPQGQADR